MLDEINRIYGRDIRVEENSKFRHADKVREKSFNNTREAAKHYHQFKLNPSLIS